MNLKKALRLVIACLLGVIGSAANAWDAWPCEVALCLANPRGPTALSQCVPPIVRAWKAWARGKVVPSCQGVDQDGNDAGEVTAVNIHNTLADPNKCPPQFVYYAGLQQNKYCALTGVTDQFIDGRLWGRIWYGGPDGQYWVEVLEQVPGVPPPTDTLLAAWVPQKQQIEHASDEAVKQWAVARAADALAVAADTAMKAAATALNNATAYIAWIEANIPAYLDKAIAESDSARAAYSALNAQLLQAKAKAESKGATPADIAKYQSLIGPTEQARNAAISAMNNVDWANSLLTSLPARRAQLPAMQDNLSHLQMDALARGQEAQRAWDYLAELEAAAAPLPFGGGGL